MPGSKDASDAALLRSAISALGRRLRANDDTAGIGSTALGVLVRLYSVRSASASELALLERLQPQSLTRALHSLEEAGLVSREADEEDRRRAVITITDEGETLLRAALRRRVEWLRRAMDAYLTRDQRDVMREAAVLMHRLADENAAAPVVDDVFNLIPNLGVADVARSLGFYERLGFEEDGRLEGDGTLEWAAMHARTVRAARIMFTHVARPLDPEAQTVVFYCWSDDVASLHARLTAAGANPDAIEYPEHMPDGEFRLRDPDGYTIRIGQPRRK